MQNSDFSIRITSLYGSQASPVDLWMQNSVLRSRMTIVYLSQPSSVVLCIQNNAFSIGFMGPIPHMSFCAGKTALLASESLVCMGPRPHLPFCACKTSWLASELLVSMGPSSHLRFLHANQRLLDQNYKSLSVTDFASWFVNAKQRA